MHVPLPMHRLCKLHPPATQLACPSHTPSCHHTDRHPLVGLLTPHTHSLTDSLLSAASFPSICICNFCSPSIRCILHNRDSQLTHSLTHSPPSTLHRRRPRDRSFTFLNFAALLCKPNQPIDRKTKTKRHLQQQASNNQCPCKFVRNTPVLSCYICTIRQKKLQKNTFNSTPDAVERPNTDDREGARRYRTDWHATHVNLNHPRLGAGAGV